MMPIVSYRIVLNCIATLQQYSDDDNDDDDSQW